MKEHNQPSRDEREEKRREALPEGNPSVNTDFLFEDNVIKGQRGRGERSHVLPLSFALVSFVLAFLSFLAVLCMPEPVADGGDEVTETLPATDGLQALRPVEREEMTTSEVYAACAPSVVSILSEGESGKSVGSGFFLSEDGYIATAQHVVAGAKRITVHLSGGKEYTAVTVWGDGMTDLALLKIQARGLRPLTFGSSAALVPGETVVAIGTPVSLDYAGSVDTGEVSYPKRIVRIHGEDGALQKKMTLIQTNAPLNPGNSGCPLLNMAGEVIGVVTMKLGAGYEGMAFAIPSDGAEPILRAAQRGETPSSALLCAVSTKAPMLGVAGESATVEGVYGVRVTHFAEGTHDASRSLRVGDLILSVKARAVRTPAELAAILESCAPGDAVEITVLRAGQRLTFSVILSACP